MVQPYGNLQHMQCTFQLSHTSGGGGSGGGRGSGGSMVIDLGGERDVPDHVLHMHGGL